MKISELNTKSFLSGPNAQANSYVLINYEDTNTTGPVTYKATVEELGKAIANNLQLYKKTQAGATTMSVNNGAYVDETAKDFITLNAPKNIMVDQQGRTGYYATTNSDSWTNFDAGVSEGYVAGVVSNLVSVNDLSNYTPEGGVSSGAVASIVNDILTENSYVKMGSSYLEYNVSDSVEAVKPSKIEGLSTGVSTGYVTNAISNFVSYGELQNYSSTGAVSDMINAVAFDPSTYTYTELGEQDVYKIPMAADGSVITLNTRSPYGKFFLPSSSYTFGLMGIGDNGELYYPIYSNHAWDTLEGGVHLLTYNISGNDLQLCDHLGQVLYTIPNYASQNA